MGAERSGLSEGARKLAHAGTLAALPLLVVLPEAWFSGLALAAALLTLIVGPRLLRGRTRPGESAFGFAFAVASIPLGVAFITLLFPERPDVIAAAWALLAVGDAAAGVVGRAVRGPSLPWRRRKGSSGFVAFLLFGFTAALVTARLIGAGSFDPLPVATIAGAALLGAFIESVPARWGDNLPVLLGVGLFLGIAAGGEGGALGEFAGRLPAALLIVGAAAFLGVRLRATDREGALTGSFLGLLIYGCMGPGAFGAAALFVFLGSAASRIHRGKGKPRSARHAFANLVLPAYLSLLAFLGGGIVVRVAFAASIAAALSDTVSGEVGLLSRRPPRLILGWERVPPGTDGGVTPLGTVAGAVGSAVLAVATVLLGIIPVESAPIVALAGFAGTLIDSLLGATVERAGRLGNEEVNFLAAAAAAFGAASAVFLGIS